MYVPLTIATPSTIAIAVSTVRVLRPSSPLSETLITTIAVWAHDLEHLRLRSPSLQFFDDQPVSEEEDAIGDQAPPVPRG